LGDRGAYARDHRVIARQALAVIMHLGRQRVDRHIAAGGVDYLDRMAARLADLDQPAGGIIVLTTEHGDAQGAFRCALPHQGGMIDVVIQHRLQVPFGRQDRDMVGQRLPAQQHAAGHAGAVGQGDLDRPFLAGDQQGRGDDIAQLGFPVRRSHLAPVGDRGRTGDFQIVATGDRMYREPNLGGGGGAEKLDIIGMQGRGARAGVDLGADRRQTERGQSDPFLPAESQREGRGGGIDHVPGSWGSPLCRLP